MSDAPRVFATVGGKPVGPTPAPESKTTMSDPNEMTTYLMGQIALLEKQLADARKAAPAPEPPAEQAPPPPAVGVTTGAPQAPPLEMPSAEALTHYARALTHGRAGYAATMEKAGLNPADPFGALARAEAARAALRKRGGL